MFIPRCTFLYNDGYMRPDSDETEMLVRMQIEDHASTVLEYVLLDRASLVTELTFRHEDGDEIADLFLTATLGTWAKLCTRFANERCMRQAHEHLSIFSEFKRLMGTSDELHADEV